ncbi:MAG: NAD(P)-dependent oxidoreductase, partial [Phyllobacteriaceae bacterium]|nr:NAD(P)-dependent oxidoreductase [Phyllobacteriaceae bacterium]
PAPSAVGGEAFRPDVIINAAGIGGGTFDPALLHAANVAVLDPLIALATATSGCLLVQLSTPATQFRFADRLGISEQEPFSSPISPYAASKQYAERHTRAAPGLSWCILRLRAGYGHGAPSMVENLRAAVRAGRLPLVKGGRAVIDLVHVDDIADAVAAVCENRDAMRHVVANVAGPEALSFHDITQTLARCYGKAARYLPVPANAVLVAGAALNSFWTWTGQQGEPPLTRHAAGALVYSQTLDLSVLKTWTGWEPKRRFADYACITAGQPDQ